MRISGFERSALSGCVAAAILAGCGGSQTPIGAPGAIPESHTVARARVTVHRIRIASLSYQVLHSFGGIPDGRGPSASLIDVKGMLYGTTSRGGQYGNGTVFSISTTGTEQVLHSFGKVHNPKWPYASLIDVNSTFYGTTIKGGAHGSGTVFSISTSGRQRVLHSFDGSDGAFPEASLLDVKGMLYGTTFRGGKYGRYGGGTIFSIRTTGTEQVLHSFDDSAGPAASLIDVNGTLYGTTVGGGLASSCGSSGCGTVFSITKSGKETILYSFKGLPTDGAQPLAGLIDVKGTLYGMTEDGGSYYGEGTVFSISTSGTEKVLHSFGQGYDGNHPLAGLIDINGTLYGTTNQGGVYSQGTVFSISASGAENVLHSFGGIPDGLGPSASLVDVNGTLYGTTLYGGTHGNGTVFALTP